MQVHATPPKELGIYGTLREANTRLSLLGKYINALVGIWYSAFLVGHAPQGYVNLCRIYGSNLDDAHRMCIGCTWGTHGGVDGWDW